MEFLHMTFRIRNESEAEWINVALNEMKENFFNACFRQLFAQNSIMREWILFVMKFFE
jgi:hypothetical protein